MQLTSENKLLSVSFELTRNMDLKLSLICRENGTEIFSMLYSRFTPQSQSVPWNLKDTVFSKIACKEQYDGVIVESETDDFLIHDFFVWENDLLKISRSWTLLKKQPSGKGNCKCKNSKSGRSLMCLSSWF